MSFLFADFERVAFPTRIEMTLSRRRGRKGDGALIIPEKPAPWNLHVKSSWVFPFFVSQAKLDALLKSSKEKTSLYTAGIGMHAGLNP